jgi:hypothetical protein
MSFFSVAFNGYSFSFHSSAYSTHPMIPSVANQFSEKPELTHMDLENPTILICKLFFVKLFSSFLLDVHSALGFFASVFGIVLNSCLLHLILNKCHSAGKLKPMLTFSSIVDLVQSVMTLFYLPVCSF